VKCEAIEPDGFSLLLGGAGGGWVTTPSLTGRVGEGLGLGWVILFF